MSEVEPPSRDSASWNPVPDGEITAKRPGRSRIMIILVLTAVLVILSGGATAGALIWRNQQEAAQRAADAAERREAREREEAREAERYAAAAEEHQACTRQLRGLMNALQVVDSRLDVGLTQSELSDLVGKASVAYGRITPEELEGDCLSAGAKLESAFNKYNVTVSDWNECIFDYSCDVDSEVLPGMRRAWSQASRAIERAERLMSRLDPDSPSYNESSSSTT